MVLLSDEQPDTPLLRVITPDATPEEVAALVAVVSAMAASAAPEEQPPRSVWASPARRRRPQLFPGPGAWRTSALPR